MPKLIHLLWSLPKFSLALLLTTQSSPQGVIHPGFTFIDLGKVKILKLCSKETSETNERCEQAGRHKAMSLGWDPVALLIGMVGRLEVGHHVYFLHRHVSLS